jgi:NADH-quinone oxidoreductase subunit C
VRERLAAVLPAATVGEAYGVVTADVPVEEWVASVAAVRDDPELDGSYLDVLLAVDEHPRGFDVVVRLWSVARRQGLHLRTSVPRADPRLASLVGVFAGAAWHEREAAEMFGIAFDGHPNLVPLLLPDGFQGHPLRKERVLAARQEPWPGRLDPTGKTSRRLQPPGSPPPVPPGEPL